MTRRDLETYYSINDMQDEIDSLDAVVDARREAERLQEAKRGGHT